MTDENPHESTDEPTAETADETASELSDDWSDELTGDELPVDLDEADLDDPAYEPSDELDYGDDVDDAQDVDAQDADGPDVDGPVATAEPVERTAAGDRVGGSSAGESDVWRRAARAFLHPKLTGAGAVIAVLVGLLGFALIAQVASNNSGSALNNDRPDDLVRILSDLDSRKDRLDTEITTLQTQQQQLSSGAESKQAALNAATERADELGILAGTLPAVGPGLVVRMGPSTSPISSILVLETIEELRGAGAEAMEISGTNSPSVRIIASTWFVEGTNGVVVDGVPLRARSRSRRSVTARPCRRR